MNEEQRADWRMHATLLKNFLREVPGWIISPDLYSSFKEAGSIFIVVTADCIEKVREALSRVDSLKLAVFRKICTFLVELAQHEAKTLMGTENLSRVFAPCLFGCPSAPDAMVIPSAEYGEQTLQIKKMLEFVLQNHDQIFPGKSASAAGTEAAKRSPKRRKRRFKKKVL